jgi:hypothetical protein
VRPQTKIALSVLALVIFGLGEYGFVEFYPLKPEQRLARARKLPVVTSFVKAADMRAIQEALDGSAEGYLTINSGSSHARWESPEALYAAYEAGDFEARQMLDYVRDWDEIETSIARTRELAEEGEPSAMLQLYMMGRHLTGEEDVNRAIELLKNDVSTTARFYLETMVQKSLDMTSREGMLLSAKVMQEDYCSPRLSEDQCREVSRRNQEGLAMLREASENGDEDAAWVVAQLAEKGTDFRFDG